MDNQEKNTNKINSKHYVSGFVVDEIEKIDAPGGVAETLAMNDLEDISDGVDRLSKPIIMVNQAIERIKRINEEASREANFYRGGLNWYWLSLLFAGFLGWIMAYFFKKDFVFLLKKVIASPPLLMGLGALLCQVFVNPILSGWWHFAGKKSLENILFFCRNRAEKVKTIIKKEDEKREQTASERKKEYTTKKLDLIPKAFKKAEKEAGEIELKKQKKQKK